MNHDRYLAGVYILFLHRHLITTFPVSIHLPTYNLVQRIPCLDEQGKDDTDAHKPYQAPQRCKTPVILEEDIDILWRILANILHFWMFLYVEKERLS